MAYYLGIDIGGTKIKAMLFKGFHKKNPQCFNIGTPKSKKKFLATLEHFVKTVAGGKKIAGIGAGIPGIVDRKHGVVLRAHNVSFLNDWKAMRFFRKFSRKVRIDNDSRCFLRAEAEWGVARGYKNIVGISIGTGIGGGIMIDGKMYYGSKNGAGEFGHTIIQMPNAKSQMLKAYDFEELAGKGAYEKWGDRSGVIGILVANLLRSFDPDMVVLGGGGISSGAVKIDKVGRIARRYISLPAARKTPIVEGKLGDRAGAIGAALLFREDA